MPIGLLPILGIGAGASAIAKRKQNRKMQGAKNVFSKKYPLLDDVASMESSIANAEKELAYLKASPPKNAAQRKAAALNISVLGSWIVTMKDQVRDLKAEMSIATTSSSTVPSMPNAAQLPIETPRQVPTVAGQTMEVGENLAAPTVKKGVNWLLIGGIAVGGYFLYKLLKK